MADFCSQCSIEVYGRDLGDLSNLGPKPEPGYGYVALCEGCGLTMVDDRGRCIAANCTRCHGAVSATPTYNTHGSLGSISAAVRYSEYLERHQEMLEEMIDNPDNDDLTDV